jgi:hypothetical protein
MFFLNNSLCTLLIFISDHDDMFSKPLSNILYPRVERPFLWPNVRRMLEMLKEGFINKFKSIINFRGNYLFPPWTTNSTKIEHSTTKDNNFPPFRQSHAVLPSFSSSFPPMNYHHLPTYPHIKQHMTRWPFVLTHLTDGRGENGCLW